MTEKTEWELVDGAGPQARPTPQALLKAQLGPHWRWKVAGFILLATLALAVAVTLAGVAIVLVAAAAVLGFGVGKLRRWLGRGRRSLVP